MATWVTGDLHGAIDFRDVDAWLEECGSEVAPDDWLLILGDFGLVWGERTDEERGLLARLEGCGAGGPCWAGTLWIDGNHENFDQIETWPTEEWHGGRVQRVPGFPGVIHLMRGEVYDMGPEGRWFCMGGARSTDKAWRTPHRSWWPQEVPSADEREHAEASLDAVGWQVDYVFTHDCPAGCLRAALPSEFAARVPAIGDKNERWLQYIDKRLTYRRWYLGHFHADRDLDGRHTLLYHRTVRLGESLG